MGLSGQPAAGERSRWSGGAARLLAADHPGSVARSVSGGGHRCFHRTVQPLRTRPAHRHRIRLGPPDRGEHDQPINTLSHTGLVKATILGKRPRIARRTSTRAKPSAAVAAHRSRPVPESPTVSRAAHPAAVMIVMLVPGAPLTAALTVTGSSGGITSVSPGPAVSASSPVEHDAVSSSVTALDSAM